MRDLKRISCSIAIAVALTVTNLTFGYQAPTQDVLSTKQEKIAFVSNRDGNLEIFTVLPDGSSLKQLTHNNAADFNPD